jgi:4'-phosphopantetheinyl transferase EntD
MILGRGLNAAPITIDKFIADLFSAPVAVATCTVADHSASLYPEEALAIQRAAPLRVAEYSSGRLLARVALLHLGATPSAIPSHANRTPMWPARYTGSISHSLGQCVAVAARLDNVACVGIDMERANLPDSKLYSYICRPEELAELSERPALTLSEWVALTFSAKEAFYKAYFPLTQHFLAFDQVRIHFSVSPGKLTGNFDARILDPSAPAIGMLKFDGRWLRRGDFVYTGVTCKMSQ